MIGIKINNQLLDMQGGESINLQFNNTLLLDDLLKGDFTYTFNVPATPHNNKILEHSRNINKGIDQAAVFQCELFFDQQYYKSGILKITEAAEEYYKVFIQLDLAIVAEKMKTESMRQIDFGGPFDPEEFRPFMALQCSGTANFVIKYIKDDYQALVSAGSNVYHTLTITNNYSGGSAALRYIAVEQMVDAINALNEPIYAKYNGDDNFTIYHTLYNILNEDDEFDTTAILNTSGYSLQAAGTKRVANDWWDGELGKFMKNTVTSPNKQYIYAMWANQTGGIHLPNSAQFVNYYNQDRFYDPFSDSSVYSMYCPLVNFQYTVQKAIEHLGFVGVGEFFTDQEMANVYLYNNFIHNTGSFTGAFIARDHKAPLYVDLAQHMPSLTLKEFFNALKTIGILCFFDTRLNTCEVIFAKSLLNPTKEFDISTKVQKRPIVKPSAFNQGFTVQLKISELDSYGTEMIKDADDFDVVASVANKAGLSALDQLYEEDDLVYIEKLHEIWYLNHKPTNTWRFYKYARDKVVVGDGANVYESEFCQTAMTVIPDYEASIRQLDLPRVDMDVSYIDREAVDKPSDLRLFIYHGMHPEYNYPFVSVLNTTKANTVVGTFTLRWFGDNNWYDKYLRGWANFLNSYKRAEQEIHLNFKEFINLQKKTVLRDRYSRYLIHSIRVSLKNSITRAKATLLRF